MSTGMAARVIDFAFACLSHEPMPLSPALYRLESNRVAARLSPPRTRFLCPLGNVEIAAAQIRTPVIFNRGFPPERKEKPNVDVYHRHGNTQVGRLRASYGSGFAQGCANDDKLSDVLAKLDERSLFKLVRDYKNGMLSIRLRTPWIIAPQAHSDDVLPAFRRRCSAD
jgi:hypothetical protein